MRSMILIGVLAVALPAVAQPEPTEGAPATVEPAAVSPVADTAPATGDDGTNDGTAAAEEPVAEPADADNAVEEAGLEADSQPSADGEPMADDELVQDAAGTGPSAVTLPDGTHPLAPLGDPADAVSLDVSGFVDADFHYLRFDGGAYRTTFRPRELEVTLDARWGDDARAVLDVNFIVDSLSSSFQNSALDQKLLDALVEQGYAEWSPGLYRFALGKMTAPMGYEALDVADRGPLTRSTLSVLATPDHFTGLMASTSMNRNLDGYVLLANGWDATIDDNRSKSAAAGVGHRLGPQGGDRWLYEGSLDGVVGAEQLDTNDLRWFVDYWGELLVRPCLAASIELVYAGEEGRGLSGKTGLPNSNQSAIWWAAALTLDWQGRHAPRPGLEAWRVVLRGEYIHDPDLAIGLPQLGGLNPMTTLLGLSATVRYQLAAGLEAGIEYRADFERGDVNNVSVQRNVPEFWNWFNTQQVTAAVIARF